MIIQIESKQIITQTNIEVFINYPFNCHPYLQAQSKPSLDTPWLTSLSLTTMAAATSYFFGKLVHEKEKEIEMPTRRHGPNLSQRQRPDLSQKRTTRPTGSKDDGVAKSKTREGNKARSAMVCLRRQRRG